MPFGTPACRQQRYRRPPPATPIDRARQRLRRAAFRRWPRQCRGRTMTSCRWLVPALVFHPHTDGNVAAEQLIHGWIGELRRRFVEDILDIEEETGVARFHERQLVLRTEIEVRGAAHRI